MALAWANKNILNNGKHSLQVDIFKEPVCLNETRFGTKFMTVSGENLDLEMQTMLCCACVMPERMYQNWQILRLPQRKWAEFGCQQSASWTSFEVTQ